jgi:nitrite reductase/ring-hydroxylating ferredoxin subunit
MSASYKAILWNKQKVKYDVVLWAGILLYAISFIAFQTLFFPNITAETLIIRTTATTAFLLLHVILVIGPLCRLDKRFLPLLYNRRHMGVSMFLVATIHGVFSILQFHSLGDTNPILSVFTSNVLYAEVSQFPFQTLGFVALVILFIMAATSHDFWLKNLSPKIWKSLHMLVYIAYALIVLHVALGYLQQEGTGIFLVLGFVLIATLHITTAIKSTKTEKLLTQNGFVKACKVNDIQDDRAKTILTNGENIAIFKYDGKLSAVNNMCKHQNGPLGEGKVIDGCITCPWHGYQYLPHNGQSPPPFTEKVSTYHLKVENGEIWVNPNPEPEGTPIEPITL